MFDTLLPMELAAVISDIALNLPAHDKRSISSSVSIHFVTTTKFVEIFIYGPLDAILHMVPYLAHTLRGPHDVVVCSGWENVSGTDTTFMTKRL